jgi:dihydroorotate dehydrogenase (NAD+) catalytic subunit
MRRRPPSPAPDDPVDMSTQVGSVALPNPVMTASGTAGHGSELAEYFDLARLGAHVVKSLTAYEWEGNPAPRLHPTTAGMINAVGLQGPGVVAWRRDELPKLAARGARTVVSIWGRRVEDYALAAAQIAGVGPEVIAVEVNLSCPNLEGRAGIFAHDAELSAEVMRATAGCGLPRWAKLSPNTDRLVEVAGVVAEAGAEAVTLVNTVLGMVIDTETGRPVLGRGGGGLSGPAIHPVAVRAVHDVRAAHPGLPIIGVGGVTSARTAVELMMAGADAVQVGTATFADPRAALVVLQELRVWAAHHGVAHLRDIVGAAHRGGLP